MLSRLCTVRSLRYITNIYPNSWFRHLKVQSMCFYSFWISHLLNSLLDHLPDLTPVGCYRDEKNDRALPDHYANFRKPPEIDWTQLDETIHQCGQVAYNKGYHYFAVQDYGECYSGNNASATYDKHGKSEDGCYWIDKLGVGKENASFVYRIN